MAQARRLTSAIAASALVEKLTRVGYFVHGMLYVVMGLLAAQLAFGRRGELADPPSVILAIWRQPLGTVLLVVTAFGLAAYSGWRFLQAIADPDRQGTGPKGLAVRIGRLSSGLGYSILAVFAGQLLTGSTAAGPESSNWAVRMIVDPIGPFVGSLVALILLIVAGDDVRKALTADFGERFKRSEMSLWNVLTSRCAGTWGFAARAIILSFAAVFLLRAIFHADPRYAQGFEGVLASMLALSYGRYLLGFVAMGLAAYGMFMMQVGMYRRHPY